MTLLKTLMAAGFAVAMTQTASAIDISGAGATFIVRLPVVVDDDNLHVITDT